MSVTLVFLAVVLLIAGWWLAHQRLFSKPWLEIGHTHDPRPHGPPDIAPAQIGLGVFLVVVGALFTLFISAYFMRMASTDWWSTPMPKILWLNTAILGLGSLLLHAARVTAEHHRDEASRTALIAALASGLAFLAGQVFAWRELTDAGFLLADNPANSFFYMISGMHGLHILGGLFALSRVIVKTRARPMDEKAVLSITLCATYWHFMLAVWLVLFVLFSGWANDFVELCRSLLT
ncbi:MAG TPA: cytochrome c oxidase subunit 3 [Ensifer sp.]|jgi:cytochrome c oxidase subunit 3|uniref:cytochrome c oxidase subunit 3 n=1 Tax=Ensifer sp. TaxID=1872086 RepID=UPI002E14842A|nr:cytochrome c oxidase subunit 3 [Ensifer sp.]